MRRLILSLFILLIYNFSCAQKKDQSHSSANALVLMQGNIDNLNNVAHNIYLSWPDSARKIAENALLLSERSNYSFGKGRSFYNIGLIYWSQSYYTVSLFYLNSAISYIPVTRPLDLSDCYNALGRTYADLENYNQALANLNKSLHFAGNDTSRMADVYSERSYVYCALNDYNTAIKAAQYALKLNMEIGSTGNIAILYARLGVIYRYKGNYRVAQDYDDIAYSMSKKTYNKRLKAMLYTEYAMLNNEQHNYDKAIDFARQGISLADSIGIANIKIRGYKALVYSFELKNDLKKALIYQKKYTITNDSLNTTAKLKTIKLLQNYHSLYSKLGSIRLMESNERDNKAKLKSQAKLILILSFSLLILISILTVTYYLYKQKQILNNKLRHQHEALLNQKQLIEVQKVNLQNVIDLKDKLLAVIGHDLRTPVANISSIIEMFGEGYLTTNDVLGLMKDISPIVKGAELTLSNLTEWAGSQIKGHAVNSTSVDVFLLGVEMEQTFTHQLQLKNLNFNNYASPGQGILADENHLKVILRNLISNAIKFTDHDGIITLDTVIENNQFIISVKDSGKGMSEEEINKLFYLNTHFSNSGTSGEKGTGIGLLLCKELVELNGGKLWVNSEPGKGSTFCFNLPLVKAYA